VSIGYVGTKARRCLRPSTAILCPGIESQARVDPGVMVTVRCNCTSSIYHSLQTSLRRDCRRISRWLPLHVEFVHRWSLGRGESSPPARSDSAGCLQSTRGAWPLCFDRPHRFVFNGVFELPFYTAEPAHRREYLAAGSSAPLTLQSGAPSALFRVPIPVDA